jgi:hypothetical protein
MNTLRLYRSLSLLLVSGLLHAQAAPAAEQHPPAGWSKQQQRGHAFLSKHQEKGVFSVAQGDRSFADPGMTALGLAALQSKPRELRSKDEQAAIDAGLVWLLGHQNEDGSFGKRVVNYTTCAIVMALSRWEDERAKVPMEKAQRFVLALQRCERTGSSPSDVDFGGVGYGNDGKRCDLSNMQFAISALRTAGLPEDHDAFQKALVFLQRSQNLRASNDLSGKMTVKVDENTSGPLAVGDDGGAIYYPGESAAGYVVHPDGSCTPRSYGSMTYALLKTYTLCGLKRDDARVQAAVQWIQNNWTLRENPGADPKLGEKARYQGLFYYYMLLAQALDVAGVDMVQAVSKDGDQAKAPKPVAWRAELSQQLAKLQSDDGSWRNERNSRWYEDQAVLCTCYALLALEH